MNTRIIVLLRKNFVLQAVSMIRAVQLSQDPSCGNHGWSRVKQPGWVENCGEAHKRIQNLKLSIPDLQNNLEEIRAKSRDVIQVCIVLNYKIIII